MNKRIICLVFASVLIVIALATLAACDNGSSDITPTVTPILHTSSPIPVSTLPPTINTATPGIPYFTPIIPTQIPVVSATPNMAEYSCDESRNIPIITIKNLLIPNAEITATPTSTPISTAPAVTAAPVCDYLWNSGLNMPFLQFEGGKNDFVLANTSMGTNDNTSILFLIDGTVTTGTFRTDKAKNDPIKDYILPGTKISFNIFIAVNTPITNVQVYVLGTDDAMYTSSSEAISVDMSNVVGKWSPIEFTLPDNFPGYKSLVIKYFTSGINNSSEICIDDLMVVTKSTASLPTAPPATPTPAPTVNPADVSTLDNFSDMLLRLYDAGFRLISLKDYYSNNISVEAGFKPAVLTFDGGYSSQFSLIEINGRLDVNPDTAIGKLMEFNKTHSDFGMEATLYVSLGNDPFAGKGSISHRLQYLISHGFDIGNSGFSGVELSSVTRADELESELGKNQHTMYSLIPGYKFDSVSVPSNITAPALLDAVKNGAYESTVYSNSAIVTSGDEGAKSPTNSQYNPYLINRISIGGLTSLNYDLSWWLQKYLLNEYKFYISDGQPNVITVPSSRKGYVDSGKLGTKILSTY